MPALLWSHLSLERAEELIANWEGQRPERLAWLTGNVGPLSFDRDGVAAVWTWYMDWLDDPASAAFEPTPVWWLPEGVPVRAATTNFNRDQAVALDAIAHFLEAVLLTQFPALVRYTRTSGKRKRKWLNEHQPNLALKVGDQYCCDQFVIQWVCIAAGRGEILRAYDARIEELTNAWARAQDPEPSPSLVDRLQQGDLMEVTRDEPDSPYAWQLTLANELASDREDLVTEFVQSLAEHSRITEADHIDRELIGIVGDIRKDALEAVARDWWTPRLS